MRKRQLAIFILSLFGLALSSYALYHHYSTTPGTFCNFSATISCDIVNRSLYSELWGVPVAVFGLFSYGMIALLALALLQGITDVWIPRLQQVLSLGALVFSLYLTYVELFVLHAICPICVSSLIIVIATAALTFWLRPKTVVHHQHQSNTP